MLQQNQYKPRTDILAIMSLHFFKSNVIPLSRRKLHKWFTVFHIHSRLSQKEAYKSADDVF